MLPYISDDDGNGDLTRASFVAAYVYREAARLIEDKTHWRQYEGAANERGTPENPRSSRACRWCVLGAITRAVFNLYFRPADASDAVAVHGLECQLYDYRRDLQNRLDALAMQYHNMVAHQVNDNVGHNTTGHTDLLRLLRVAAGDLSHDEAWKQLRSRR